MASTLIGGIPDEGMGHFITGYLLPERDLVRQNHKPTLTRKFMYYNHLRCICISLHFVRELHRLGSGAMLIDRH